MSNKLGVFLAGGLVGAAAALLCAPRTGAETRGMVAEKVNDAWGQAVEAGNNAGIDVQGAYDTVAARAGEAYDAVSARAGEVYDQVAPRVKEYTDEAQRKGAEVAEGAKAKGQEVWQQVSERGQEAYEQASAKVQGVVGNVTGSPVRDTDELRDKIEAARQRIAEQVAKNAQESAAAQKSPISVAAEKVEDIADEAKEAAEDAVEDVKDEAEKAKKKAKKKAKDDE